MDHLQGWGIGPPTWQVQEGCVGAADCATFEGEGDRGTVPRKLDTCREKRRCGDCASLSAFSSTGVGSWTFQLYHLPGLRLGTWAVLPVGNTVPHR